MQLELFQGFDTFSGNPRNTVVTGTSGTPTRAATSYVMVCTDLEQLHTALQIDASVSASYGAFSADAKAKYVHDLDLTTNSVTVVVYACNNLTTGRTTALLPPDDVAHLTDSTKVREFVLNKGDSFVSEITKGGEYFATFTFLSQTSDEKTTVEASLQLKAGTPLSLDASVSTKLSSASSSAKVAYKLNQRLIGVSGVTPPAATSPSDIDGMVKFAMAFPSLTVDAPETVSFKVDGYEQILPMSVDFSGITQNRDAFLGTAATPGWGQMIVQLRGVMNDGKAIKNLYDFYGGHQDSDLDSRLRRVQQDLSDLYDHARAVEKDPTTVLPVTPPESCQYGSPEPEWIVVSASDDDFLAWGGAPFQDVSRDQIAQRTHLDAVEVWVGSENGYGVWRVRSTYSTRFPGNRFAEEHGGHGAASGGQESGVLTLADNEFITSMEGWAGSYFRYPILGGLILHTSAGQRWTTAHPPTEGVQVWPDPANPRKDNQTVIGFTGASGDCVNGLRPLAVQFRPVNWRQDRQPIDPGPLRSHG